MAVEMKEWTLEIHHIDVGGGDATAIIVKDRADGTMKSKVLIDAGAEGSGSQSLKSYMQKYLGDAPFDYIIASHYHNDHIDGFRQCGVTFKKYIDVGGYTIAEEKFTPANGTGLAGSPAYFGSYTGHIVANGATREKKPFIEKDFDPKNAKPLQLQLGEGTGITLTCYCANGVLANGTNVLKPQKDTKSRKFNPNDLSLVFILEWEGFRYFTAGDLSGDPTLKSYYNVEGELVQYLIDQGKKPITAMKVNHHGSERSNYPGTGSANGFLDQLEPETLIIPCNISKNVPSPIFLQRAYTYCANKKATVVFVNDEVYYSSDKEYDPVVQMQKNPALNCNIQLDDSNKTASNDTKAIIIRRHSGGQIDAGMLEEDDVRISKKGYAVILKKGKIVREGGMISRPPDFGIRASFPVLLLDLYIKPGFANQAEAIIGWLQSDESQGKKEGIDYVKKFFPAFTAIKEKDALTQAMEDLFDNTFQVKNLVYGLQTIPNYSPDNPQLDELSIEQKQTIFNILMRNKYQVAWNCYLKLKRLPLEESVIENYSSRTAFWNDTNEPYQPSAEKRKAESEPDSLSKEPKTET